MMVTLQSLMMHQLDVERTPSLRRSTVTVSTVRRAGDALDEVPALRAALAAICMRGTRERQRGSRVAAHPCAWMFERSAL